MEPHRAIIRALPTGTLIPLYFEGVTLGLAIPEGCCVIETIYEFNDGDVESVYAIHYEGQECTDHLRSLRNFAVQHDILASDVHTSSDKPIPSIHIVSRPGINERRKKRAEAEALANAGV